MVIGNENYEWEHLEKVSANTLHTQLIVQLAALTQRDLCAGNVARLQYVSQVVVYLLAFETCP